jgi:formylglycine-generating enzyme
MKLHLLICAMVVLLAPTLAAGAAEPTLVIDLGNDVKLEMALVPKGTFTQGSPESEAGRNADEPQRQVTLTNDFYLGKFPVTVGQFAQFVRETGYATEAERGASGGFGFDGKALVQRKDFTWRKPGFPQTDAHPVTLVTFDDARAFNRWLAKKTRRKVTLPSEAQWEYACRAGTTTRFYNGDKEDDLQEIAWYRTNAGDGTRPVGRKQPNPWGLYDLCGNVYEWCRDWYGPYEAQALKDPEETRGDRTTPPRRVLRGGSWLKDARSCRAAARWRNTPGRRNADNGFRVAASVAVIVESEEAGARRADGDVVVVPPESHWLCQCGSSLRSGTLAEPVAPARWLTSAASLAAAHVGSEAVPAAPLAYYGIVPTSLGLLCFAVPCVGLVIVIVVVLLIFANRQSAPPLQAWRQRSPGLGPTVFPESDLADDGFWLDLANVSPGSMVHYRCTVHGEMRDDTILTEPGPRQFIYTGGRPTEVTLLETMPPGASSAEPPILAPPIMPVEDEPAPPPLPSAAAKCTGYPAAY